MYPAEAAKLGQAPSGSSVASGTMTSNTVTFTGLSAGREYVAYALVSGQHRYSTMSNVSDAPNQFGVEARVDELESRADSVETGLGQLIFNVKDRTYGAVGDNSTNDTTAVQAAITAAGTAGGGVVFFPKGVYKVGALTLPSNVRLQGVAYDSLYTARGSRLSLIAGTNATMFTVPWTGAVNNIVLENLHLEGNLASQSGTSWGIYFERDPANAGPQNYQQSFIFRCSIKGFLSGGVYVGKYNGGAVNVNQCLIGNNGGHGVAIENSDCSVTENHIVQNTGDGVRLGNSACLVAHNHSVWGNLRGIAVVSGGAQPEFSQGSTLIYHKIIGNQIDKNLREGIYVEANYCLIAANSIGSNSQEGNGLYSNVNIGGRLSDSTFAFGNAVVDNIFEGLLPGITLKPQWHMTISNYSGSSSGVIRESGNVYDLTGTVQTAIGVSDFSMFQGAASGQLSAGHFVSTHNGTTSIAAGAGAGTTPPTPTLTSGNDARGQVNIGTGTSPAAGLLATITFAQPYRAGSPRVMLTPINAASAALQAYVGATTTAFTLSVGVAPTASQTLGTYGWYYTIIG